MVAAIGGVVLILVGLPLLAWWVGGRPFWARLRGRPDRDPWGDLVRGHGLSPAEAARVSQGVQRGVRFEEPRLRAAAVDWAVELLDSRRQQWPRSERARFALGLLLVCWITALVTWTVFQVVTGRAGDVNWVSVVFWTAFGAWTVRRRRMLRRSLAENGGVDLLG